MNKEEEGAVEHAIVMVLNPVYAQKDLENSTRYTTVLLSLLKENKMNSLSFASLSTVDLQYQGGNMQIRVIWPSQIKEPFYQIHMRKTKYTHTHTQTMLMP